MRLVLHAALQRLVESVPRRSHNLSDTPRRPDVDEPFSNDSGADDAGRLLASARQQAAEVLRDAYAERDQIRRELLEIIDETITVVDVAEDWIYARFCEINGDADRA